MFIIYNKSLFAFINKNEKKHTTIFYIFLIIKILRTSREGTYNINRFESKYSY
jgi:hypothetical protein